MALYRHRPVFETEWSGPTDFQYVVDVDFQLYSFQEYIKLTEQIIEEEIKQKIEEYNNFLADNQDEDLVFGPDSANHDIRVFTHQLYYNSIFIALYAFLEKKMYQLCRIAEERHMIKLRDLSDDGIFKYYKYFKKVLLINMDEVNSEWSLICKYNKLRNRLVHFPTNVIDKSPENSAQIDLVKSIEHLTTIDNGTYIEYEIGDKEFLLKFCATIECFLHTIYYVRHNTAANSG